ncbi:hypothetical protein AHAS_Ahas05G0138400 [Arachis hypogaea]
MAFGLLLLSRSVSVVGPPKLHLLIKYPVLFVCRTVADLQSIATAVVTSSDAVFRFPSFSLGLYSCF